MTNSTPAKAELTDAEREEYAALTVEHKEAEKESIGDGTEISAKPLKKKEISPPSQVVDEGEEAWRRLASVFEAGGVPAGILAIVASGIAAISSVLVAFRIGPYRGEGAWAALGSGFLHLIFFGPVVALAWLFFSFSKPKASFRNWIIILSIIWFLGFFWTFSPLCFHYFH